MTSHYEDRAERLRVACVLLAPRDGEDTVRVPLSRDEAMARIRAMRTRERHQLTARVNWVREYEQNEVPEMGTRKGAGS